ncbi:MAG: prolyl oligopeptidase family serine peptidase [Longimicrobiales bacterium]|nr:prolyl oligopeptidase family serine peptidase [Longimicrobiales bacterium]
MATVPAPMLGSRIRPSLPCLRARRMFGLATALVLPCFLPTRALAQGEQGSQPPGFADYGRWETLSSAGSRGGISPDGRWIAYGINRTNGENELRITGLAGGAAEVIAFGAQAVYSSDSRWIAYRIGQSEAERERLREDDRPVQNKLGMRKLEGGETVTVDGIEAFSFSPDGAYLAMRRYPPERPRGSSGNGRAGSGEGSPGTTIILRQLETGRDMTFGNVSQFEWEDVEDGHLLAMVISAEDQLGNGVQLFDAETSELRVLESSNSAYSNLSWRTDAPDLAVLRSKNDDAKEGPTEVVLAWTGLGGNEEMHAYDPTADPSFPVGMRTVPFRSPSWSPDGRVLFLGIAKWEDKIVPQEEGEAGSTPAESGDSSSVDIWHWTDVFVMPWQKTHAAQDRERNMLAAWHVESGSFVQLGQELIEEEVTPIAHSDLAFVAEWSRYAMERSIGRPGADLYLQDINTGERTLLKENINDRYVQASPGGGYLLFMDDGHFWTIDLSTRSITNVTASAPLSFIDEESDETSKVYPDRLQKPPFGVAGWTTDDAAVLLYDDFDLWAVAADGSGAERLTDGAADQVRHRLVRLDRGFGGRPGSSPAGSSSPADEWIDLDEPQYLSLYGEWTKLSGYGVHEPGGGVERLVWLDKNVGSLAKAEEADVFSYVAQGYDDSPDIFVSGPTLGNARQVTTTNPFQSDYAWGHSELVEYETDQGRKLQGALIYPAGYEPGKKYPMIVYNYELLSQNLHRYVAPSDRSYYNTAVFMSQGYLVLQPDIVFRPRQPGWSVVECIGAAVEKVIELGVVDPERIGIVGHSMGGFNTSFVATNTHGMFAAAVAGAPITDLVSYYGDHHWSSGIAETDHIETGQERMEVALYEDFQAYVDNSAVFNAHAMTVPLLLEAGDDDGTVAWYQSIELYNIARRAKRNVVMLTYAGEGHGLTQEENQRDYQQRILAWFGHYLKGEPAEPWITEGKSFLERDRELKRLEGVR